MVLPATSIDEVLVQLDAIITSEIAAKSALVFFPVLYRKVTVRIKEGIEQAEFEDNVRMETLDVIFANRYISAYHQYKNDEKPTQSWFHAFEATKDNSLLIMQHLLLGINAHINLDLGIAASETVGNEVDLHEFQHDFNKINAVLASMVDSVQKGIGLVSPLFYLLEKVGKGREDKVVSFSINMARDGAWLFANQYHRSLDRNTDISDRDALIGALATKIYTVKSRWLRWTIKSIRWLEQKDVARVVSILEA